MTIKVLGYFRNYKASMIKQKKIWTHKIFEETTNKLM